ncbi:hypothetical protein C7M84_023274, partial [Penaeus vannamei]
NFSHSVFNPRPPLPNFPSDVSSRLRPSVVSGDVLPPRRRFITAAVARAVGRTREPGRGGQPGPHRVPAAGLAPPVPDPQVLEPEEELRDPQHPAGLGGSRGHEERRQEVESACAEGQGASGSAPSRLLHRTRGGVAEDQHFLQYLFLFLFFSIDSLGGMARWTDRDESAG